MSPSEVEALSMGVVLEREERKTKTTPRWFFFVASVAARRHSLSVKWPTRAGAWQAAVRWVKQLRDGRLK